MLISNKRIHITEYTRFRNIYIFLGISLFNMYNFEVYFINFVVDTVFVIISQFPITILKMVITIVFIIECCRTMNQTSKKNVLLYLLSLIPTPFNKTSF